MRPHRRNAKEALALLVMTAALSFAFFATCSCTPTRPPASVPRRTDIPQQCRADADAVPLLHRYLPAEDETREERATRD
jgi:hypothetical protein